jgi:hypothetical protein
VLLIVLLVVLLIVLVLFGSARQSWRSSETLGDRSIAVVWSDLVRVRRTARCYAAKMRRR